MVREDLHLEIMQQLPVGAFLLYVGDKEQLPPVKGDWGPDFDYPTAELTEVHRQAQDNPIIQIATKLRTGGTFPLRNVGKAFYRQPASTDTIAKWCAKRVRQGDDCIVLSFTKKVRRKINNLVREELGFREVIQVGDRLKVAKNNRLKGRVNGEVVTVESVEPFEGNDRDEYAVTVVDAQGRPSVALTQPKLFGEDQGEFNAYCSSNKLYKERRDRYLHFDYGYAITVHSAQGSEWQDVGFVFCNTCHWKRRDDPEFMRRLMYTAATRAISTLTVFDHKGGR
jgi:exodeoxyribonuclease-5